MENWLFKYVVKVMGPFSLDVEFFGIYYTHDVL